MAAPPVRNQPGRPPLRKGPAGGISYRQGRPHPSDPDYEPPDEPTQQLPAAAPDEPAAPVKEPAPASEPAPAPRASGGMAEQASGALLALFAWPLLLNLVRGGPPQMWGWLKAKFINQPYGSAAPAGTQGQAPAVPASALQLLQQPALAQQLAALGINPEQAANALVQQ